MKKKLIAFIALSALIVLSGCQQSESEVENLQKVETQEIPSTRGNIAFTMENDINYPSDSEITLLMINDSDTDYYYGPGVQLHQKISGEWYLIPFKEGNIANEIGYALPPAEMETLSFLIDSLKEDFSPGEYRLVKGKLDEEIAAYFEFKEE